MERIIKEKDKHGNVSFGSVYFITFSIACILFCTFFFLFCWPFAACRSGVLDMWNSILSLNSIVKY